MSRKTNRLKRRLTVKERQLLRARQAIEWLYESIERASYAVKMTMPDGSTIEAPQALLSLDLRDKKLSIRVLPNFEEVSIGLG